ncbi:hypothetical protein [Streptomyces sp. NPDC059262]|uniref:hypothetical protein n=1 Tax=Streptomyces sp. NPDC059262 TaxID=3346797 RepID=UPI003695ADD1
MIPKNATTATALVGGYFLGRTKKAKMAIGVGMFLAGRKLDLDPRRIGKLLAASPVTAALSEQVRGELFEATKSAATQALTKRASGFADSLQQRTEAIGRAEDADVEDTRDADEDVHDGDAVKDGASADEDGRKRARPAASAKSAAKSTAKSTAKKSSSRSPSRDGSSGGGSPPKATTARKRASAPKKATQSRTRRRRSENDE